MSMWEGVSWSEGVRVGWMLSWRGFLISAGIGFVIGFFGGLFGIPKAVYISLSAIVGPLIAWPVTVSQMLRKKFSGFHIAIVRDAAIISSENPPS